MKNLFHISMSVLLIGSSLLLIACGDIDKLFSLRNDPIMKVKDGMSKSEVIHVMGEPLREITLRQIDSTCLDYITFTKKKHEPINHAIIFNNEKRVRDIYTLSTCDKFVIKPS